jgi:hypothetical protein
MAKEPSGVVDRAPYPGYGRSTTCLIPDWCDCSTEYLPVLVGGGWWRSSRSGSPSRRRRRRRRWAPTGPRQRLGAAGRPRPRTGRATRELRLRRSSPNRFAQPAARALSGRLCAPGGHLAERADHVRTRWRGTVKWGRRANRQVPRGLFLAHRSELLEQAADAFRCMFREPRFSWFAGDRDDFSGLRIRTEALDRGEPPSPSRRARTLGRLRRRR